MAERRWTVGLKHLVHGTRYLTVRATDSTAAILKAENLVEGTGWFPLYAGCQ